MGEPQSGTLYQERERMAMITLNRPEKSNALTEAIGPGGGRRSRCRHRIARCGGNRAAGANGTLTAGYDLGSVEESRADHQ